MKTKLHFLTFALLFAIGIQAQTVSVTSTLPSTIETGDALDFTVDYTTDSNNYNLIVRFYEDNGGTITRYGTDQSFKSIPSNTSGTEVLNINAPLVAASNYIARIFIENSTDYSKFYAADIPFTVTAKVVSVKDTYLFDTDGDLEGWDTGSIGAPNITATVSGGAMVINTGSGSWDVGYVEQTEYKLDPAMHTYLDITYKNLSKPNENNQIELDWITSGTTRSSRVIIPIETSGWNDPMDFTTVTYDLGANPEWAGADATYFRIYVSRAEGGPKSKDLEISSIVFNNPTLSTNNLSANIENVSIYPNPFTDSFSYKFNGDLSDSVSVELFSIVGKKINTNNTFNGNSGIVDTAQLNKGIYLVRISSGKVTETRKLIKK